MDRPISLMPLTPAAAWRPSRDSYLVLAIVALALVAAAVIGLPDLAPPVLDVGLDPAGAFAPPF
jgi:hypothetical protein